MWVAIPILLTAAASNPMSCPYANELPGFKLCSQAPWRTLQPLESTFTDVRRVLGSPTHQADLAHYDDPDPGDEEAGAPVLTLGGGPDWEILVYFVKSSVTVRQALSEAVSNRLLSIDLLPKRKRSFAAVTFPPSYRREYIFGEVSYDEYSDGSGLAYEVYATTRDLDRIRYGPSDEAKAR